MKQTVLLTFIYRELLKEFPHRGVQKKTRQKRIKKRNGYCHGVLTVVYERDNVLFRFVWLLMAFARIHLS